MSKYSEIAELVKRRIRKEDYTVNRFPGIRKLAEDCGVSYLTPFVAKEWQHKGGGWVVRGPMPDIKLRELSLNPEGKRRQK